MTIIILYIEKEFIKIKYQANKFYLFYKFSIGPFSYQKKYFNILDVDILVKCLRDKIHLHPQLGPDTHYDSHKTWAERNLAQPLLMHETIF